MLRPDRYREWMYLSTGFDMSYNPAMRVGQHRFNNVFVNPAAYRAYSFDSQRPATMIPQARGTFSAGYRKDAAESK